MGRSASGGIFTTEWQHELSGQDAFPGLSQSIFKLSNFAVNICTWINYSNPEIKKKNVSDFELTFSLYIYLFNLNI